MQALLPKSSVKPAKATKKSFKKDEKHRGDDVSHLKISEMIIEEKIDSVQML